MIYPRQPTPPKDEDPITALLAKLYAALTLRSDRFDRTLSELRTRIAIAEAEIEAADAEASALDEATADAERECARLRRILRKRERTSEKLTTYQPNRRNDQIRNPHKPHPKLSNPLWRL